MNTKKLYIADFCVVNGPNILSLRFNHIKYILVKRNRHKHAYLREIDSNNKYYYDRYSSYSFGEKGINNSNLKSFNAVTGNKKKYLSKKKVLNMYNKAVEDMEEKNEKNI